MNAPYKAIEEALQAYFRSGFRDGDLVSHDWLQSALDGAGKTQLQYMDHFELFRAVLLREHQIALENVWGKGYRVVPPQDQARYAAQTASAHITRGLRKATALLHYTRRDEMTDAERQRHTDTEVRMGALAGMMGGARRGEDGPGHD